MSSPEALVLVTSSFPISGDGSEAAGSFVSDLAGELAKYIPVRVVAPGSQSTHEKWNKNTEVFRYAAPSRPLSLLKPWIPGDLAAIRRVLLFGEKATRQAVNTGPTKHLLALWAIPSGHWARRVSTSTGIPYSVWTLGSDIWTWGQVPLIRTYLRRILKGANACYSDGIKLANDTRRIAGREVHFLPSTRAIERVRTAPLRAEPPYRLLFLGRWHPNKGVDMLLDALQLLEEIDWRRIESIDICGGGPLEAIVKKGVESLRASGRPVSFRGFLDKAAAEEAIIESDYLLIPSRTESIPLIFSDAMKLKCPVVATPVGDLAQLVSGGKCGVLANSAQARDYHEAIARGISSPPTIFGKGIDQVAATFRLENVGSRLLDNILNSDNIVQSSYGA